MTQYEAGIAADLHSSGNQTQGSGMHNKSIQVLYDDLPQLVAKRVVTPEIAARLPHSRRIPLIQPMRFEAVTSGWALHLTLSVCPTLHNGVGVKKVEQYWVQTQMALQSSTGSIASDRQTTLPCPCVSRGRTHRRTKCISNGQVSTASIWRKTKPLPPKPHIANTTFAPTRPAM